MSTATRLAINWVEQGLVPDAVIRKGIRRLCEQRLREIAANDCETALQLTERFVSSMDAHEIAPLPHLANEQHYEVPAEFFALALGPHRKYSSAWWPQGTTEPRGGRGRGARRHLRARRARGRPDHPRARLRLGLAHAVDGGALSRAAASPRCPTRARSARGSWARPRAAACATSR